MAKLNAKLAVDNSDLWQVDGLKPNSSGLMITTGTGVKYINNKLTVKVFTDSQLHYVLKTDVARSKANKLFKGDNWESKFFKGADVIKGSSEGDSLYGYNGKDKIFGDAGDDFIYGGNGADTLYGGAGSDIMDGGKGKDTLYGGEGANTLTGGGGKDAFVFDAALMPGNNSHITDFKPGSDKIHLDQDVFTGIGGKGKLGSGKFVDLQNYTDQTKVVVYDKEIGSLAYVKASGDLVYFGSVSADLSLGSKDFLIV